MVTYEYDIADRVTAVSANGIPLATNITYEPFGGAKNLVYGNNLLRTVTYDTQYRITGINTPGVQGLSYGHDANGNLTAITNTLVGANSKTFAYDALNRLTSTTGPFGSLSYTYDAVGNWLLETLNGATSSYTYSANKLTTMTGPKAGTFQYDANGNTVTENARQFTYNSNNRLIKAAEGAVTLGEYLYDGSGRWTIKKVGAALVDYHYDQSGFLISETTETGASIADYVYLNGQPLAKIEGNTVYYLHPDHLGTPVLMTDAAGSKVWESKVCFSGMGRASVARPAPGPTQRGFRGPCSASFFHRGMSSACFPRSIPHGPTHSKQRGALFCD